jgi:hypothetical protein
MEFEELDLSEVEREKNFLERKNSTPTSSFLDNLLKFPDGAGFVICRILPARPKQRHCCHTRTHVLKSTFMERVRTFHCIRELNVETGRWEGECPICAYWNDLWYKIRRTPEGLEQNKLKKEASEIRPVDRYYFNALAINSKPPTGQTIDDGPLILSVGKILYTKFVTAVAGDKANEIPGLGNVTHPITGRNFKIIKAIKPGDEKWPEYGSSHFLEESRIGTDEQIKEWLEKCHDLQSLRRLVPGEELLRALRIYKGKEKDRQTSFDLSELDDDSPPAVEVKEAPSAKKFSESKTKFSLDDSDLANDPFIQEMNEFEG